jgi:hypothetical protein
VNDAVSRALRTIVQMLAGGAFAVVFDALVKQVDVQWQTLLAGFFTLVVAFAQNYLEDTGRMPTLLGKKPVGKAAEDRPKVL